MKKLKAILFACVVACFASYSCTGTYTESKLPAYANKSGEVVKIVAIANDYEKFIANGDTLHNYSIEEHLIFLPIACDLPYCYDKPIRVELHFLGEPEKCLIFDGPTKNDGIDMRSWDSYKKGNEIDEWWDGYVTGVEYVYTITSEHREMAKEEYCQSSAGELQ